MNREAVSAVVQALACRCHDQVMVISESGLQRHIMARVARMTETAAAPAKATVVQPGQIAVFRVNGVLVPEVEWFDEVSSKQLAADLLAAAENDEITAGVLWINSPGGFVQGMLELEQAAATFAVAKPLIAQVEGYCCSGAYWLASQAHLIYCGPRDDVGSIGVRSTVYDLSGMFAELGIEAVESSTGPLKSLGVPGTPVTDEQRAFLKHRVDATMVDFSAAVRKGRKMTDAEFAAASTGGYWPGEKAREMKLVDGIQSLKNTVAGLLSGAKTKVRSKAMSEQIEAPKAATVAELKKAMPKSTAEFRESQIEAGATLAEAQVAYTAVVLEENAKLVADKEAAEKKATDLEAAGNPKKQVAGLGGSVGTELATDVDPREAWNDAIEAEVKAGKTRANAVIAVGRKQPELRKALVAAANS